jgi:hypothetical protein
MKDDKFLEWLKGQYIEAVRIMASSQKRSLFYKHGSIISNEYEKIIEQYKEIMYNEKQRESEKCSMSKRAGHTHEMVMGTVAHFLHAAKKLWIGEFKAESGWINPTRYDDKPLHGDSRIHIFADLKVNGGEWIYQVNICNEFTSAQTILDGAINDLAVDEKLAVWGCKPLSDSNDKPKAKPAPQQQKTQQQAPPSPITKSPQQTSKQRGQPIPEDVDIIDYDYKQKDMYNSRYRGKPVVVNVAKLRRVINAKKDGTGSYECIEVYGYHNGYTSKHPIYDLRMFPPTENQKWSNWDQATHDTDDGLLVAGDEIEIPMQLVYKVNPSKQEGDKRVFWNLREVRFLDDAPLDVSDAPDWGKDEQPAAHEIPWDDGDPDNDPGRHLDM